MKYYVIFLAFWLLSCQSNREISFDRIDLECYISKCSKGEYSCYKESFIIYNYKSNIENEEKIDSFVCNQMLKDTTTYKRHWFTFYNHSRKTNLPYIAKHLKNWNGYAVTHDLIISYEYRESKFDHKSYGRSPKFRIIYDDRLSCDYD